MKNSSHDAFQGYILLREKAFYKEMKNKENMYLPNHLQIQNRNLQKIYSYICSERFYKEMNKKELLQSNYCTEIFIKRNFMNNYKCR